jgi:hypothetical protein
MSPKIKVKPTPAQARILRALDENLGLFIRWSGKGGKAYWTGMGAREVRAQIGNPTSKTMGRLESEDWIEEQDPDVLGSLYRERLWRLSTAGFGALALLQNDDFMSPAPEFRASEIIRILRTQVFPEPYWLFVTELSVQHWSPRRLDGFALRVAPSVSAGPGYQAGIAPHTALTSWALEVKVSRSDFLAELAHPRKRDPALAIAHRFAFVTPAGLVKREEIPEGLGLIEVNSGRRAELRVRPSLMVPDPPDWRLVASLARAMMRGT